MELGIRPIINECSIEAGSRIHVSLWSKKAIPNVDYHWVLRTTKEAYFHELNVPFVAIEGVPGAISGFHIDAPTSTKTPLRIEAGKGTEFEFSVEYPVEERDDDDPDRP